MAYSNPAFASFETVYRRSVEITTAESRSHFLDKHILNYFKHKKLSDIDTFAIDEFYEFCSEEGLSPATIKIIHSLLNQAFKKAVKWKLIKFNPVADSSPPPIRNSTKEETNRFLEIVNDQGVSSIYVTAIFTGMRRGENLGLKWSDIDFHAGTIHV
jgi:integrase